MNYLKILVEDIHSVVVATMDQNNKPITRVIDMMLYDENGLYFLTAKGKEFYKQLMEQEYMSLSCIKDKKSISLSGSIRNIGHEKLDEIFDKNEYMKSIYPDDSREVLEVFQIYKAQGQYFDISNPSHIERGIISIGEEISIQGYSINDTCIGCSQCVNVCPQKCIGTSTIPFVINQNHCLHCGRCVEVCPNKAISFQEIN